MLDDINLEKVLVLDIETVPAKATYEELQENFKELWCHKCNFLNRNAPEPVSPETLYERAGIYAEFGKVACISAGYLKREKGGYSFRIKSYCGDDERQLLQSFTALLQNHFGGKGSYLCAHNGREFDFPYLGRRMLINGLKLPAMLNVAGRKSWELNHLLDTMQLWRFGDYKNYTSLTLLAAAFGIPSPKDDINGSDVGRVYWQERDLDRISRYCAKDVVTVAQLLLKMRGLELLKEEDVIYVE
ncbi:MAG: ribonuclease H-like domain-containing protein [Bacteroidia bacterium]